METHSFSQHEEFDKVRQKVTLFLLILTPSPLLYTVLPCRRPTSIEAFHA